MTDFMSDFETISEPESAPPSAPNHSHEPTTPSSYVPPNEAPVTPSTTTQVPIHIPLPSLGPIILGFFLVIFLTGVIGVVYFQSRFRETSPSPTPSVLPSIVSSPSPESSIIPSSSPKATFKPISVITPMSSPKPTPVPQPTLDIRFGNPSGNVKQTIDEGQGDGRVINREYTSIQAGQFDEVSPTWSPRVTVCFHLVVGENIVGKDLNFSFSLDDKVEISDNLGGYDKLEAGRLYDWCHDVTTSLGKHTAKMLLNPDKSLKESNYNNDLARVDYENLSDKIPPNFTIDGPYLIDGATCMRWIYLEDNISTYTDVWGKWRIDGGDWSSKTSENPYGCVTGTSGSNHTYSVHAEDYRGNVNEQTKTFMLY